MSEPENTIQIKSQEVLHTFSYNVKTTESGCICYIPAYDMHFSAKDEEEAGVKSIEMVHSFFRYWLEVKKDLGGMALELGRLGWRGFQQKTLRDLLKRESVTGKLKTKNFPVKEKDKRVLVKDAVYLDTSAV